MFGKNRNRASDMVKNPEAFRAWEEEMFTWHAHVSDAGGYTTAIEVAADMRTSGASEEAILDLPNKVADLLMRSAATTDVIAPPYRPDDAA